MSSGKISVSCEGYNSPDDAYVLQGSCGLEYTLDLTEIGKQRSQHHYGTYGNHGNSNRLCCTLLLFVGCSPPLFRFVVDVLLLSDSKICCRLIITMFSTSQLLFLLIYGLFTRRDIASTQILRIEQQYISFAHHLAEGSGGGLVKVIGTGILLFVLFSVFRACLQGPRYGSQTGYGGGAPGYGPGPGGYPPGGGHYPPGCSPPPPSSQGWTPGFWSGAATGGLLGYLFRPSWRRWGGGYRYPFPFLLLLFPVMGGCLSGVSTS